MGKNTAYGNHRAINPNYFEQKEQEAGQVDSGNKNYSRRLHFINLQPCTAEDYYNSLKDWSEMEPFKKPKKKYVNKEAGIFGGLRIKAFFSVAVKVELDEKKKQADAIYEADVRSALDFYNKRAKYFYEVQQKQHEEMDELHRKMKSGDIEQIEAYYSFALRQDTFSTDFLNPFQIDVADVQYDEANKKLRFAYRIPNSEEILTFSSFYYDQDQDAILPKPIEAKYQLVQKKHIMHRVLLRALIMTYASDAYGFLNDVEITGFLEYHESSYGTLRRKDVVNFHMNREEFAHTDFERVDVELLFSTRLKPKESSGLYSKKAEEIADIYIAKGKANSNTKTKK